MHFMDDHFVNLGEEVILTQMFDFVQRILWDSFVNLGVKMYVRRCTGFQHLVLNPGQKVDPRQFQVSSSDLFHNQFVTCKCVCVCVWFLK